jgi:hypothetical protein
MTDSVVRVVRIRTTDDRPGQALDIVTGTGATPQLALAALWREAQDRAEKAVADAEAAKPRYTGGPYSIKGKPGEPDIMVPGPPPWSRKPQSEPQVHEPRVHRFEVIDVRLTPTRLDGADSGWLAYGTLAREGGQQQACTTRPGGSWPGARAPGAGR